MFGWSGSIIAGSPDTISFGRPVEPPDVGAFHAGEMTSGNGSVDVPSGGRYPMGRLSTPSITPGSSPTTTFGEASSTIAANSRMGRRDDTGCGTAPNFQQAT